MNIFTHIKFKSFAGVSRAALVLSLLVGLFLPLSSAQAEVDLGAPTIHFTVSDTAICMQEPGVIEATVVVSIPGGGSGKLITEWYVSKPFNESPDHHYATHIVYDGDEITYSGVWPGVNPGDEVVELHFGAALIVNYALVDTASLDYYWYPWVCGFDPTPTPTPIEPTPTGEWDKSSLYFKGNCTGDCSEIQVEVCNGAGSEDMQGPTVYQVYYIEKGNPKNGTVVDDGQIPALQAGECTILTYNPLGISGNYMFRAEQRPGHPGSGELWSLACSLQCQEASVRDVGRIGLKLMRK